MKHQPGKFQPQRKPALLGLVIVVLCGLAILSWRDASEPEPESETETDIATVPESKRLPSPAVLPVGPILPLALPPLSDYAELVERPLFNPNRRPLQAVAAVLVETPPLDTYSLVGVINDTQGRRALLRDSQAQLWIVRAGENLQGWTVESVLPDQVTLRLADQEHVIAFSAAQTALP